MTYLDTMTAPPPVSWAGITSAVANLALYPEVTVTEERRDGSFAVHVAVKGGDVALDELDDDDATWARLWDLVHQQSPRLLVALMPHGPAPAFGGRP